MTNTSMRGWRPSKLPDLTGRTAVITGANQGLGFVTARILAESGARVVMAVRSPEKGEKAKNNLLRSAPAAQIDIVNIDLSSQASVKSGAGEILDRHPEVHYLINNAGIMAVPQATTEDGFESQFASNHLGHFTLTAKLLPSLIAGEGRVVALSSLAAREGTINFDDLQHEKKYNRWTVYQQSKLANLMFAIELAARAAASESPVTSVAAHPGVSATNLGSGLTEGGNIFTSIQSTMFSLAGQSPEAGAIPVVYAAAGDAESGSFIGPDGFGEWRGKGPGKARIPSEAKNGAIRKRLWSVSEELTGVSFNL